jgi:hypothetical protein
MIKRLIGLIHECIDEVLMEATGSINISQGDTIASDPNNIKKYTTQGINVNLSEMARSSSNYKLADNYQEKLDALDDKTKNNKWIKGIIDYLKDPEHPEASIATIAKDQFDRPQQAINMLIVNGLVPKGILVPSTGQAAERHAAYVTKQNDIEAKRRAAEENGEEFNEPEDEDNEDSFWTSKPKRMKDFDDVDDLFVGNGFSDDFDTDTLTYDSDNDSGEDEDRISPLSQYSNSNESPESKAAEFFLNNDRLLQRMINTYGLIKQKSKRLRESEGEDNTISSRDYINSEKRRSEQAKLNIDTLVSQFIDKIKEEQPEVQQAIIDMLGKKFPNGSHSLYNRIVKKLGSVAPVDVPEPSDNVDYNDEFGGEENDDESNDNYPDISEIEDNEESLNEGLVKRFQLLSGITQ